MSECLAPDCPVYLCPGSGEIECATHGGFDVCCWHPACFGNGATCRHLFTDLDHTLCGVCWGMHWYCNDCGVQTDPCGPDRE